MNGLRNKLKKKILIYLNSRSLMVKFTIICVCCILLPIIVSCTVLSYSLNKNLYNREMDNLNFVVKNAMSEAKNIFDDAVAVGNVIAYDQAVIEIGNMRFDSELDYYEYMMNNNLKDYYGTYIVQKPGIDGVKVYLNNNTILSGGILWKLTDAEKESGWYKTIVGTTKDMVLCRDNYLIMAESENKESIFTDGLSVVRRLYRGNVGGAIGYIRVSINMAVLKDALNRGGDYMLFYLVNEDSNYMYDPKKNTFYSDLDYINDIERDKNNITVRERFSENSYFEDWQIVGVYDRSRIMQKQFASILLVVLSTLMISAAALGVVYIIYRSYNDRISKLISSMENVENEEFNEVEGVAGTDEIGKLMNSYNHMINKINVLINDVYKLEAKNKSIEVEKVRAELKYLQSQVNPHFIFNVLNAILVVSVKNGYTEIAPQISGLAKMLRRLLDWSDDSEPLSNELGFIEIYLKLEKFRFGDKFNYEINVRNGAEECSVPKMIVQPLIENACRHGLQGITGDRLLVINADLHDNVLLVSVKDNGKGIPAQKLREINDGLESEEFKGHIGMKNVYRRLKLYFGDSADMDIRSEENKGTEIIITIDYNK